MKLLIIRLSSLGDIVLATSFLESLPPQAQVDWIIRSDFAFALQGHPKIRRLIPFSKREGLGAWLKLMKGLAADDYYARVDLHSKFRSRIAFLLFRIFDLRSGNYPKHYRVSKERVRSTLYFIFKEWLPKKLRPRRYWLRFAELAVRLGGPGPLPPSYLPVLKSSLLIEEEVLDSYGLSNQKYYAIMPAASFHTKEWSYHRYRELVQSSRLKSLLPVLLGRLNDLACRSLRDEFRKFKIPFVDLLSEPDFKKTAIVIKHAQFYLGSDTGLAHLAEAVGTPANILYGPTRPDIGFGPWQKKSASISIPLGCAPCSKDGKFCYRFFSPYSCLKNLSVEKVEKGLSC